ncbi:hypothetical protein Y032_0002g706 [Ancylostoma ceylanicum]|uniref:Uncharacterized protein n=1 Tax=Ancylostoma ceylanicum TaxID=53326 RepID=A0A016W0A4_9BILA|nr:hypothetical protein Y032_0002g706 [Ancylostoma ceylanicum]
MTIPVRYINKHRSDESPFSKGSKWLKLEGGGGSLQVVLADRHGYKVGQRVLPCPIDNINGFTRQVGSANCYKPRPGKRV